jgi:alkanesulfonate monooxygenase SsuD/methylene tetrahydromethanopterin reductase-like flavin-dependent oxidoreductase (luciferase family)
MHLGMFMQPIHDPERTITDMFEEDRAAIILADQLDFSEAWVGEHTASSIERVVNPLQFFASLLDATRKIKFATGVYPLPQHHPARVAGDVAQFDHISKGRFIFGIGPGATPSDWELFETWDKNKPEMVTESIDMILKIWSSNPPYNIPGKYWSIKIERGMNHALGFGPMLTPYQQPHPEIACSVLSPNSSSARQAGERGWGMASANFLQPIWARSHWEQYLIGAEKQGVRPDRSRWRIARSILVADTDAEAADYLAEKGNSYAWYYQFVIDNMRQAKIMTTLKATPSMPDDEITLKFCLDTMVYSGSPKTVLDRLIDFVDQVGGPFGGILYTFKEWDRPDVHKKSMRLMAHEVMPRLRQYCATKAAAE